MIQIPAPPPPPVPPQFDPNLLLLEGGAPLVLMIVLATLAAATVILWPIMRAIGRRLEPKASADADPALRTEVDQLYQRLGEVDALQVRVNELEERLDFAERLLTRGQEAPPATFRTDRP